MANSPVGQSANDLIRRAAMALNAIGSGETLTADEAQDSLFALNAMLDSWDTDGRMIFTTNINDFPLTSSKQQYTLGAGGDFNIDRPATIDRASIVILSNPNQPLEYPIPIYSTQDWQEKVPIKTVPGNLPLLVYDDGGYPLRNLTFWPVASDSTLFRIYVWARLQKFTDLTTLVSFPPAYERAVLSNLAIELAATVFPGIEPSASLVAVAMESKALIKSANQDDVQLRSDLSGSTTPSKMRTELFNIP